MHKLSARAAKVTIAASAIVMFGGFATYAAAQVSTKPAPQVVIPRTPATDNHGVKHTGADDRAGHDATDDKGAATAGSDDRAGHDATDDKGGATAGSEDPARHDATDDKGGNAVTPTTSAKSTTPTSVDDHGGKRGGSSGSGGHGSDG